jgi:hypothetical protein
MYPTFAGASFPQIPSPRPLRLYSQISPRRIDLPADFFISFSSDASWRVYGPIPRQSTSQVSVVSFAAADRRSWPTMFAEPLGAEGPCVGERSSSRATNFQKPRQIQAVRDKYCMAGFQRWLAERGGMPSLSGGSLAAQPNLRKQANDYAASLHDPVVLGRIRKAMEAEAEAMRRKLGIKTRGRRGLRK